MASSPTAQNGKKRAPFSWTQPVCMECWNGLKLKTGRLNQQLKLKTHFCCFCRKEISQGVDTYGLRINPGTVPYPTVRKDE
jgi:hypothetical protein